MQKTSKKIDQYTVEITKELPVPQQSVVKYERGFIEKQIKDIQASKDEFDTKRDTELAECNAILLAMNELGIISKKEEVSPVNLEKK